ncbi:elongation factor P [Parerythrobacter aestuarii]|uniref:elongation factor P n=1 Tax=Parerythrobacter aestuarii TaxID=3020909 RepID=UPI0024DE3FD6|nr:elongation factor P [Parerythrobacter aestuarii]
MKRLAIIVAGGAALAGAASPVLADGPLKTLPVGRYQCSLPGDAGGSAWVPIDKKFSIKNASRYLSPKGSGTYLMTGDDLVFTRGPLKDEQYKRQGTGMLRLKNADGSLSRVRCVRTGPLQ